MSKRKNQHRRRGRRLRIREDLRREPDVRKIANTVIALAMAQAEKEAEAQGHANDHRDDSPDRKESDNA